MRLIINLFLLILIVSSCNTIFEYPEDLSSEDKVMHLSLTIDQYTQSPLRDDLFSYLDTSAYRLRCMVQLQNKYNQSYYRDTLVARMSASVQEFSFTLPVQDDDHELLCWVEYVDVLTLQNRYFDTQDLNYVELIDSRIDREHDMMSYSAKWSFDNDSVFRSTLPDTFSVNLDAEANMALVRYYLNEALNDSLQYSPLLNFIRFQHSLPYATAFNVSVGTADVAGFVTGYSSYQTLPIDSALCVGRDYLFVKSTSTQINPTFSLRELSPDVENVKELYATSTPDTFFTRSEDCRLFINLLDTINAGGGIIVDPNFEDEIIIPYP